MDVVENQRWFDMDVDIPAPLVSVIVPIYNVAPWLRQCLDSLKAQTLNQIEVIMIDDGSTDGSGEIAEEYVSDGWPRFRLIRHGENRGLSAARKTGIEESRAEHLMFVDSDDWVDEKFCEIPYGAAIENQADMVIFGYFERHFLRNAQKRLNRAGFLDHEVAVDVGNTFVWNKLYRKLLFEIIRYPEGCVYEDVAATHKLIYRTKTIIGCGDPLYFHRIRRGSISRITSNRLDDYSARLIRYNDLVNCGYPHDKALAQLQAASLAFCGQADSSNSRIYQSAKEIVNSISITPREFKVRQKMMLTIWRTNEHLYRAIYAILGKRMRSHD